MPDLMSYTNATLTAALIAATEEDATFSTAFVAEIPNIIKRGESRCYADLNSELFDRVKTGALTPSQFLQAIKTSTWQGTRTIFLRAAGGTGPRIYLRKRSYEYCQMYQPDETATDTPLYYAEYSDTQFFMTPAPNAAYAFEMREISANTALSVTVTTAGTWLSLNAGDLLFSACMVEAERWLQGEDADVTKWEGAYQTLLQPLRVTLRSEARADYSPVLVAPRTVEDRP